MYMGEDQFFDTMGLAITEGRGFNTDEYIEWADTNGPAARLPSVAVITRSMAQAMFPDGKALGRNFYGLGDDNPVRIVGIVDHLVRPNEFGGDAGHEYSMVFPVRIPYTVGGRYLLRTDPARRAEVLEAAAAALTRNNPNRIVLSQRTFEEMRANYYKQDRIMAWLLVSVIVALLVVTALGIVGLASFWVQQRTRQIGVRRALGATRAQILRYFQTENFLLVSIGLVLGMMFAFGLNQFLMAKAELPRLPLYYLPFGALALWLLGQIAVFWPARRAAAVPPAIATRSA
jgi:putative ABC transport system permease protein